MNDAKMEKEKKFKKLPDGDADKSGTGKTDDKANNMD